MTNKMSLIQISPGSFSPPTDVTLKLSDGNIDAHKMILAAVSPVFERMFYGDFKEGNAKEVELPEDSYKIVKPLVDFIYNGSCELESLDEIGSLLEIVERYQINKVPLQHMCDEAILPQLDSSNYLTLLPKYVSVMSEEGHKKAADKVMSYTNNDFVTKFDQTKDLPEEVMLPLMNSYSTTQAEISIFEFLVKWHEYQTKDLGKSLKLASQLFQSVRYFLIPPQVLSSKVMAKDLADRHLISRAFDYLYSSPCPLGSYGDGKHQLPPEQFGKPSSCFKNIHWVINSNVSLKPTQGDSYNVSFRVGYVQIGTFAVKSMPLSNGMHSFNLSNLSFALAPAATSGHSYNYNAVQAVQQADIKGQISVAIFDNFEQKVVEHPVACSNNTLITLCVHDNDLFLKLVVNGTVKTTTTTTGGCPFVIHICNLRGQTVDYQQLNFSIRQCLN